MIDILLQPRRNRRAAERFFRKLLKGQGRAPRRLITDKLRSYAEKRNLAVLGTLRVLADGAEHGFMNLRVALDRLRQTNFIQRLLAKLERT